MCRLLLMTIACLAILFGISGLYMMPKLIQRKIEERMQLKIGTKNFDRFTRVPIPLKVKFYFFNVTNSEQVLAGLERPHFEEVGPFMFEQWRRRSIVDIVDNNRKIIYKEYKTFYSMWPEPQVQQVQASAKIQYNNHASSGPEIQSPPPAPPPAIDSMRFKYLDSQDQKEEEEEEVGYNEQEPTLSTIDKQRPFMLNPYKHNVTIINLPLLSVLTKLADLEEGSLKRNVAAKIVSRLIKEGHERILINRPVNELLFDGYKVGVMEAARELVSTTLGFNFESPLPRNKFGFFHGKNNTWKRDESGELTIFTGRNESMNDFMMVDNWNGMQVLNTWPKNTEAGNRCNEIKGTDGSQFHPGVTRDHVLGIFSPMICTSIQVKYKEDTSCRDIPLLRFTTTAEMFAAPKKSLRNACYCTIKETAHSDFRQRLLLASGDSSLTQGQLSNLTSMSAISHSRSNNNNNGAGGGGNGKSRITNSRCYIDGLMDLSLCQKGAPVAASAPHFFNGDPLLSMAAGLQPNKSKHETYMDIEPMTGAVMRAASRAQLNAFVEKAALEVVEPELIGHMTPMVAPMLWLEESAQIDERSANDFKKQLLNTVYKARRSFLIAIIFGILLALSVSLQFWYVNCYKLDATLAAKRRELARKKKALDREAAELKSKAAAAAAAHRRRRSRSSPGESDHHAARRQQQRAVGARKSNLAARQVGDLSPKRQPLVELVDQEVEEEEDQFQEGPALVSKRSVGVAATAAAAVAAALGAADSAATRNQPSLGSNRNRLRRSGAVDEVALTNGNLRGGGGGATDEDELSRRGLVENEWGPPEAGTSGGSGAGSGSQTGTTTSSSGHGDQLNEPSTSNSVAQLLTRDGRAFSSGSSLYSDED